mmetsp:Transcript_52165/g.117932  ORF Transcript_52165/g.117932 Transcript_52165/m.117932 type:complete len:316 (-) Transcript_52165:102-1049(-)
MSTSRLDRQFGRQRCTSTCGERPAPSAASRAPPRGAPGSHPSALRGGARGCTTAQRRHHWQVTHPQARLPPPDLRQGESRCCQPSPPRRHDPGPIPPQVAAPDRGCWPSLPGAQRAPGQDPQRGSPPSFAEGAPEGRVQIPTGPPHCHQPLQCCLRPGRRDGTQGPSPPRPEVAPANDSPRSAPRLHRWRGAHEPPRLVPRAPPPEPWPSPPAPARSSRRVRRSVPPGARPRLSRRSDGARPSTTRPPPQWPLWPCLTPSVPPPRAPGRPRSGSPGIAPHQRGALSASAPGRPAAAARCHAPSEKPPAQQHRARP